MTRLSWLLVAGALTVLLYGSHWLARHRIYQVDECQNVYVARLLATGQAERAYTGVTLFLAPVAWLARHSDQSTEIFARGRYLGWGLMWLNLVLLMVATGERVRSWRAVMALAGAATMAPMWDFGFEIRHDNLLLTGLLVLISVLRAGGLGGVSYAVAGFLVVTLEFVAFKAFVYTIPMALIALTRGVREGARSVTKALVAAGIGGLTALILLRVLYGSLGWWDFYVRDVSAISSVAAQADRFGPWLTLSRLVNQLPLVVALAICGLCTVIAGVLRLRGANRKWAGLLPEALLLVVAFVALVLNPAPYPYNVVNLAPFVYLFSWRYTSVLVEGLRSQRGFIPIAAVMVVAGHLLPFAISTRRHFAMPNTRQERLMRLAEAVTVPQRDPVYDGIGMVPTRHSISYHWFLHSLNVEALSTTPGKRLRDMLQSKPAAVIIPSYRTDWLPAEDHEFMRQRYVPLADDFWVVGQVLPPGGGTYDVVHPGRYRISDLASAGIVGTFGLPERPDLLATRTPRSEAVSATLDGTPLGNEVAELSTGRHQIECPPSCRLAVVWVGPTLNRPPTLTDRDHRLLFVNWY